MTVSTDQTKMASAEVGPMSSAIKVTERDFANVGISPARAMAQRLVALSQATTSDQIQVGDVSISIVRTPKGTGTYLSVPHYELDKLRDKELVSILLDEGVPRFNPLTDVAITRNGLPKGVCDSVRIVKELKGILGEPDKANPTPKLLSIAGQGITFQVAKRGTSFVWKTDQESGKFLASLATPKLVSAANPNIPHVSQDESGVFAAQAKIFGVTRGRIEAILSLLPDPSPTRPEVTVVIDDQTLVFKVRVIKSDFKWCIDTKNAPLLRHRELAPTLARLADPSAAVLPDYNPSKELVVSGPSFKESCDVKGQLLDVWRKAAEGLELSESRIIRFTTDHGSESLEIGYRALGGKPILVITPRSVDLVKSVEALHAIDPTAILPVELYGKKAIPCSLLPLRSLGIRNGSEFAEKITSIIGDPPREHFSTKEILIEGGTVRFFSVRSGSSFVWALDSRDKELFTSGNFFKVIYPDGHLTFSTKLMVALTPRGLSRVALKTPSTAETGIPSLIETLSTPPHQVPLFTASLGSGSIQCFMRSDLDRFRAGFQSWSSSLGVTSSLDQAEHTVQRDELEEMCPALTRLLDSESKSLNHGATIGISIPACNLEVKLVKTRARGRVGFALRDIDREGLRQQLSRVNPSSEDFRATFGDYGIKVNLELLAETHGKYRDLYAALIQRLGHEPSSPSAPLVVDVPIETLGTITFYLPHDAPYDAWYVAPPHAARLTSPAFAAALGVRSTIPYREADHLRLSCDEMQQREVPNAKPLANKLSDFLGKTSDHTGDLPVDIGPLQAFIVALPSGHISWAIRSTDAHLLQHPTVESILFEGAIPPFNPKIHVSISPPQLAAFVHRADAARDDIMKLVGTTAPKGGTLEERIDINGTPFQLPYTLRRSNTVLCIRKEDLPAIAAAFQWTLREDTSNQELDTDSDLVSAISLLGSDERDLAAYLLLSRGEISADQLTFIMKKVRAICKPSRTSQNLLALPILLDNPEVAVTQESDASIPFLKIRGRCAGATEIQLTGDVSRILEVASDGTFEGNLPIPGARNITLEFMALNHDRSGRSDVVQGEVDLSHLADIIGLQDTALFLLLERRGDIVAQIQGNDPASTFRRNLLTRQVVRKMLRHFSKSETEGFSYLEARIEQSQSRLSRAILGAVRDEFNRVNEEDFGEQGSRSFFFQRWAAYKIREAQRNGEKGIMLSFDPGLGKTRTALLAIGHENFLTIVPNAVVSFWAREAKVVRPLSAIQVLSGSYAGRDVALSQYDSPTSLITNIEYVRQEPSGERIGSLSRTICVVDEAHFLCNDGTSQSQAISNISSKFKVLLTATPFARYSGIGPLLSHLTDGISYSRQEISRVFSPDTPEDLVVLHHLLSPHMIYLGKEDLFDGPAEGDSVRPPHTLPRKRFISPEEAGQFVISHEQLRSQIELMAYPDDWALKHKPLATYEDRRSSCYRNGYFEVHAAIDQITNDPEYIGSAAPSPKHEAMRAIVEREVLKNDAKIVIMCRYRKQVEKYASMFDQHGVCAIWGEMPQNHRGEKVENGKLCRFETDRNGEFILDQEGRFIPHHRGRPILASDYELHEFQKRADKRILIATYDCAALGITATAGQAMVFDQIPASHLILSQAMDRIHRLDATFSHPEVRYYFMVSRFPDIDIDKLIAGLPEEKRDYVRRFLRETQCELDRQRVQKNGQIFSHIIHGRPSTSAW